MFRLVDTSRSVLYKARQLSDSGSAFCSFIYNNIIGVREQASHWDGFPWVCGLGCIIL